MPAPRKCCHATSDHHCTNHSYMRFPALGIHDLRVVSPPSTESRRTPRCAMESWIPPSLAPASAVASFSGKTGLSLATSHSKYWSWRRRTRKSRLGKMTATGRLPHSERENEGGREGRHQLSGAETYGCFSCAHRPPPFKHLQQGGPLPQDLLRAAFGLRYLHGSSFWGGDVFVAPVSCGRRQTPSLVAASARRSSIPATDERRWWNQRPRTGDNLVEFSSSNAGFVLVFHLNKHRRVMNK